MGFLLGYDVGSSSVKASLIEIETSRSIATAACPEKELSIIAHKSGWAEQDPQIWWDNVKSATQQIKSETGISGDEIKAVGISYQMHGLVVVDQQQEVLRPAIIWCDSRAVQIGEKAAAALGEEVCLKSLLNLPGNFTASKLKWVMENEPDIYSRIYKIMLPGDYIAMKMTERIATTPSGLSEGIMWDYQRHCLCELIMDYYGFSRELIAEVVPTFCVQGELTKQAAKELGLKAGTVVSYRAGDQPNNALSLNVLNPGEIAATAGTSGVVYGVTDKADYDDKSRVNTFVHVNYTKEMPRYGVLLCLNGTGILNSWLRKNVAGELTYDQMNELALKATAGCEGLVILPYGNGAERTLENKDIGALIKGLNFNVHSKAHLLRAAQEGIVFALNYGLEIMRGMEVEIKTIRAGNTNMFLSSLFGEVFATVSEAAIELYDTDGSKGAAIGAGIGAGIYKDAQDAFVNFKPIKSIEPNKSLTQTYIDAYKRWKEFLEHELEKGKKNGN